MYIQHDPEYIVIMLPVNMFNFSVNEKPHVKVI